jgi:ATP-dependent protease ClpP protease subunit
MNNQAKFTEDCFLLDSGRIFIRGEINEESEEKFIRSLRYCMSMDIKDIYVYISSEGGDLDAGCAIIDEINGAKKQGHKIYTIAIGKAYSAAAYILTFGSVRYATENASIMLHPVLFDLDMDYIANQRAYTAFTDYKYVDIIKKVAKNCKKKTRLAINKFIQEIQHGLWICPKQAKKMKIIDDIWDYSWEKDIDEQSNKRRNKDSSSK